MDRDKIKEALDLFENDNYVECKEILISEIKKHKELYINESIGVDTDNAVHENVDYGDNDNDE